MKICTVNVPESYCEATKKLVGEDGLYPSRSELVRVACREFLIRELSMCAKSAIMKQHELENHPEVSENDGFVRVPVENKNLKGETVREFKTYKILKRLEDIYPNNNENSDIESLKDGLEKELTKNPRKNRRPLGNIYFDDAWDERGNLVRVPKKDLEILNSK